MTMVLSLLLVFSFAGSIVKIDAFAAPGDTVTRAEWLSALVETFDMTVEDDTMMPDNYFSDLDPSSSYYKDFLLAVQFGLVNVEAGDPVNPDEPATREFAASTLNFCLGFQLDENAEYTFSDAADMADPASAQVAVDHGWLALIDGKFSPSTNITVEEKAAMLADASEIWHSTDPDENHQNEYEVKTGVIEVPDGTQVDVTADGNIIIIDSPVSIAAGDKFVIHINGIPVAYEALSVDKQGSNLTIEAEEVENEEAFDALDLQGTMDGSALILGEANPDLDVVYDEEPVRSGTKAGGTIPFKNTKLSFKGELKLGEGKKVSVDGKYSDIKILYNVSLTGENYIKVTGKTTFSAKASFDMMESLGINEIPVVPATVPGVGGFDLIIELKLGGSISITSKCNMTMGLSYIAGGDLRMIKEFTAPTFSMVCEANGQAGLKARLGITGKLLPFNGYVYAGCGGRAKVESVTYPDGTPKNCTTFVAWFYAEAGAEAKVKVGSWSKSTSAVYEVFNDTNSPLRVYHHYEDFKEVPRCTREDDFKYYTKWNSAMWPSGWSGGIGGYGYDEAGEPVEVYKYEIVTIDYIDYAKINGFYGNVSALTIPDTIDGYKVIAIKDNVFKDMTHITSVVMGDDIEEIGVSAFRNCTSLSYVYLPKGLKKLGHEAFRNDVSLSAIEIPKSLEECSRYVPNNGLSYGPFSECTGLKTITFEDGAVRVASNLFAMCTGLEEIVIPDTVASIDEQAFKDAGNLRKVTYSKNLTKIGNGAFWSCTSLTDAELSDTITLIDYNAYRNCTSIETVHLPKGLKELGHEAFGNNVSLSAIEIPKSLAKCTRYVPNTGYAYGPFADCTGLKTVTFEEGRTNIIENLFAKCTGLEEIVIPDTVVSIDTYAFKDAENLRKVTYSKNLTTIGSYAFKNCKSLSDFDFQETVQSIGDNSFYGCSSLTKITIPPAITTIGDNTFRDTTSLKTIVWNDKLTTIGQYAFAGSGIEETELSENVTTIKNYAFSYCPNLKKLIMHDLVTSLGTYVFTQSDALTDVTFSENLTVLPASTFEGCDVIAKVVLPHRITTINGNAFKECPELREITIFRNAATINTTAFPYMHLLTIYGVTGTYAETFANDNNIKFVAIDNPATNVTLKKTELSLNNGASETLLMSVTPADYTDAVSWKSNNDSIVTVDDGGKITAKGVGTASIRVTVGSVNATCKVTVVQPVTSINLNKTSLSLDGGSTFQLTATPKPDNAEDKSVTWSSSDEKVATVSETGFVTALKKGTADITVTSAANPAVYKTCKVTVNNTQFIAETVDDLESPHNYDNNCTDSWSYTDKGALGLKVTFSDNTFIDDFGDYLYLYNADGSQQGEYTGDALAGKTVEITGDTVVIKFKTDASDNAWGFKVTNVERLDGPAPCEHEFTAWQDGGDGTHFRECTKCGEKETENHTLSAWTSKNDDVHARTCDKCGYEETEEHAWKFDSLISEPTLTEGGKELYVCTVCEAESYGYTEPASTGSCGDNVYYSFDPATGVLTISGSGDMYDYNDGESPFSGQEAISGVVIEEGVTSIGSNAFQGDADIESLSLPSTLETIKAGALEGCSPSNVTYAGSAEDFAKINMADDAKAVIDNAEIEWTDPGEEKTDISNYDCTLEYSKVTYDSIEYCPAVTVGNLVQGTDFNVIYENNRNAGTAKVTVVGIGDYTGSIVKTFVIEPADIANAGLTLSQTSYEYTGQAITPKPTSGALKEGVDFELSYKNNTNAGTATVTATGKGNYTGTWSADFTITDGSSSTTTDLSTLDFKELEDFIYDGSEVQPCRYNVKLKSDSTVLRNKADYTVEYRDNVNAGTGTAILTGVGKYSGTAKLYFTILPFDVSEYKDAFNLTTTKYVYDGKVKAPKLKCLYDEDEQLIIPVEPSADDYTIKYDTGRKNVGKYNVKFTFDGNFTGTQTYSFVINPKATAWKSLTAVRKGFTAKWSKRTIQTTGYQIQYSTSSTFKTYKNVWIKKTSTVSKKVTKLKAKKKYYVRIRTYKTVNGTKYYSAWTTKRSVTTKK